MRADGGRERRHSMDKLQPGRAIGRREFLRALGGAAAAASLGVACRWTGGAGLSVPEPGGPTPFLPSDPTPSPLAESAPTMIPATPTPESLIGRVALIRTTDRAEGVRRALDLLGTNPVQGKTVFLKPNFNSADPAPGSTHTDTLRALVERLWEMGAGSITLGDRSGMGDTRAVMQSKGIFDLASELAFETVVFDDLGADGWVPAERAREPLATRVLAGPPGRRSPGHRADLQPEDAPLRRPLHAIAQELGRSGGEVRPGRRLQLHDRAARLAGSAPDDRRDQRRLHASADRARRRRGFHQRRAGHGQQGRGRRHPGRGRSHCGRRRRRRHPASSRDDARGAGAGASSSSSRSPGRSSSGWVWRSPRRSPSRPTTPTAGRTPISCG